MSFFLFPRTKKRRSILIEISLPLAFAPRQTVRTSTRLYKLKKLLFIESLQPDTHFIDQLPCTHTRIAPELILGTTC